VQAARVQRAPVAAGVTVRRGALAAAQNKYNQDGCICMPEEKGLKILLQRADVDVNDCGGCSRAAAPSLQLRAAGEEVPVQLSSTERA
jgi:hypothetical protein